ncbi:hypothetical protein ACQY0O_003971 [Thecaphora frezii]
MDVASSAGVADPSASSSSSSSTTTAPTPPPFPTYRQRRPATCHEPDADDAVDEDDDEALFAELEREVEAMDDEQNYPPPPPAPTGRGWIGEKTEREEDDGFGFDLGEFRERRMEEIRQELLQRKQGSSTTPTPTTSSFRGRLVTIHHEKELIHLSAQEPRVAIHFFHPSFERCKLLDRHLEILARLHPDTLFLRANALDCPFLTQKLNLRVLPCLVTFKEGTSKDRMVGFEEVGNSDRFTTGALEWRLGRSGVVDLRRERKPILGFAEQGREGVGEGVVGANLGGRGEREGEEEFWLDD